MLSVNLGLKYDQSIYWHLLKVNVLMKGGGYACA